MPRFVLEIGTEEIPACFLPRLMQELHDVLAACLDEAILDYSAVAVAATPRRLVAQVADLAVVQSHSEEVLIGPPAAVAFDATGQPTKAALGFAQRQGVAVDKLFCSVIEHGEYVVVRKASGGAATIDLLPSLCAKVIVGLPFPKRMRWGSEDFSFCRPIRWILAMLDEQVVPFKIAGVVSGNLTYGHRVLGPGPWSVPTAAVYPEVLLDSGRVVLDVVARRQLVVSGASALMAASCHGGGRVVWNDGLLDEVCCLVEWPRPLLGGFNPIYLALPREVLLTCIETHQKSFGVEDDAGKLLPYFLCVINLDPIDTAAEAIVRKGWERVLQARLEDACFFWKTDLKYSLEQWQARLEQLIFLAPLGSMADKSRRITALCDWLARSLAPDLHTDLMRAGELSKADLVSEIVGEFSGLQGVMGCIYARRYGESEIVARAIYEQYLPAGPDSPVPDTLAGALLALADKADTLAGCFGLGIIPTGAADPYALRRAVLGICRIVLEHGLDLDVRELFQRAFAGYGEQNWEICLDEALDRLMDFLAQRLKRFFSRQGFETLVVEAVARVNVADLRRLKLRLEALAAMSREPDFCQAVLTFKRAANIIRKQSKAENLNGRWLSTLLIDVPDKVLAWALEEQAERFETLWHADDFQALFSFVRQLQPTVDAFFDGVMVMCDDPDLCRNRLNLLKFLIDHLGRLADFTVL